MTYSNLVMKYWSHLKLMWQLAFAFMKSIYIFFCSGKNKTVPHFDYTLIIRFLSQCMSVRFYCAHLQNMLIIAQEPGNTDSLLDLTVCVVNDTGQLLSSPQLQKNDVIILGVGGRDRSDPPQSSEPNRLLLHQSHQHPAARQSTLIHIIAGGSSVSRASSLSNNNVKFLHIAPKTRTRYRQGI